MSHNINNHIQRFTFENSNKTGKKQNKNGDIWKIAVKYYGQPHKSAQNALLLSFMRSAFKRISIISNFLGQGKNIHCFISGHIWLHSCFLLWTIISLLIVNSLREKLNVFCKRKFKAAFLKFRMSFRRFVFQTHGLLV